MRLLFLALFFSLAGFSQKVIIDDVGQVQNMAVDSLNKELFLFYDGYFDKYDLNTYSKQKVILHSPSEFQIKSFTYLEADHKKYFISNDGGVVYRFVEDSVYRIDNSFEHRMQTGSNLFVYNSRVYRYGGYGFWSVRNFLIYFDKITREWEVNDLIRSEKIPDGTYASNFVLDHDDFYFFGGLKIDPYKRRERIDNDKVWKYNFKDHKWTLLGDHPVMQKGVSIKYGKKIIKVLTNRIAEIDVIRNKVNFYEHNLLSPKLDSRLTSFYLDHQFYCFISKRGTVSLKVMDEKDFLSKRISGSRFYTNSTYWWSRSLFSIFMVILLLLSGWFAYKYHKKRNKIQLLDNGVRYKNKFIEFDRESMTIIKTLLAQKEVSSVKILSIVEKEQYSSAHNERLKIQKINDINLKIKTLLGINEDMITSFKSVKDKRIRIYKMSKEYFS